jgi:hypothetical protein
MQILPQPATDAAPASPLRAADIRGGAGFARLFAALASRDAVRGEAKAVDAEAAPPEAAPVEGATPDDAAVAAVAVGAMPPEAEGGRTPAGTADRADRPPEAAAPMPRKTAAVPATMDGPSAERLPVRPNSDMAETIGAPDPRSVEPRPSDTGAGETPDPLVAERAPESRPVADRGVPVAPAMARASSPAAEPAQGPPAPAPQVHADGGAPLNPTGGEASRPMAPGSSQWPEVARVADAVRPSGPAAVPADGAPGSVPPVGRDHALPRPIAARPAPGRSEPPDTTPPAKDRVLQGQTSSAGPRMPEALPQVQAEETARRDPAPSPAAPDPAVPRRAEAVPTPADGGPWDPGREVAGTPKTPTEPAGLAVLPAEAAPDRSAGAAPPDDAPAAGAPAPLSGPTAPGAGAGGKPPLPAMPAAPQDAPSVTVSREGADGVAVSLDDPQMGALRLVLTGGAEHVHVTVDADRGETADLVRRGIGALLEELRNSGYASASFAFSDQGGRAAPARDRRDGVAERADAGAPGPPGPIRPTAAGRLDLRL